MVAELVPDNGIHITWEFGLSQGGSQTEVAEFSVNFRLYDLLGFVEPTTPPTDTQKQAIVELLCVSAYQAWATHMLAANFPASLKLVQVRAAFNDTANHTTQEAISVPGTLWVGTATQSLPWQLAFCISNYAYTPGSFASDAKNRRGRCYLPPFGVGELTSHDDGQVASADVIGLLSFWDAMITAVTATDLSSSGLTGFQAKPGVLSPTKHLFYPTLYWRADGIVDTQRRRRNREVGAYQVLASSS
jgi:hypothetical protein